MSNFTLTPKEWSELPFETRRELSHLYPERAEEVSKMLIPAPSAISPKEITNICSGFIDGEVDEELLGRWMSSYEESGQNYPASMTIILAALIEQGMEREFKAIVGRIPPGNLRCLDELGVRSASVNDSLSWKAYSQSEVIDEEGEIAYPTLLGLAVVKSKRWAWEMLLAKGCSPSSRRLGNKEVVSPTALALASWKKDEEAFSFLIRSPLSNMVSKFGSEKSKKYVLDKGEWSLGNGYGVDLALFLKSSKGIRQLVGEKFVSLSESKRKRVLDALEPSLRSKLETSVLSFKTSEAIQRKSVVRGL